MTKLLSFFLRLSPDTLWRKLVFFCLYLQAFFLTNQTMMIGEGRNSDYPVNNQLRFHPHLSLFTTAEWYGIHCRCCTSLSSIFNLPFYSLESCSLLNKIPRYLKSSTWSSNLLSIPLFSENHSFRVGHANSHPNCYTLSCKLS